MGRKRYNIVVEDPTNGSVRRFSICSRLPLIAERASLLVAFTLSFRRCLAVAALLLGFPTLIVLGARWTVRGEVAALETNARMLEVENDSYRAATRELNDQIETLQGTIAELGRRSTLDPTVATAMTKLPGLMKSQSAGGGTDKAALSSVLSPSFVWTEDTFGVLRELLRHLESRLRLAETDIDRRQKLAAATPTIWPAHGWLSDRFGRRRDPFTGLADHHTGLDISADKGQPVFATANGTVQSAAYNGNYGNLVTIDHGFGIVTRYGHLSQFLVGPGEKVTRGQTIGRIGSTGRATGPHLHYEIIVNGTPINPFQLLTEPRAR